MTTLEIVRTDEQILYTKQDVVRLLEQQKKELVHEPDDPEGISGAELAHQLYGFRLARLSLFN